MYLSSVFDTPYNNSFIHFRAANASHSRIRYLVS